MVSFTENKSISSRLTNLLLYLWSSLSVFYIYGSCWGPRSLDDKLYLLRFLTNKDSRLQCVNFRMTTL